MIRGSLEQVLIIFVEVVASDGPVTEARKKELLNLTDQAGFEHKHIVFVSAFEERSSAPLKKRLSGIATNSLIWCMAEPGLLIWLDKDQEQPLKFKK